MTHEWARFWSAMAVINVSGAAVWMTENGSTIGSIGEWAAAIGTIAAVLYALCRDRVSDRKKNLDDLRADLALVESIHQSVRMGISAFKNVSGGSTNEAALVTSMTKIIVSGALIRATNDNIAAISPHLAKDPRARTTIMQLRSYWFSYIGAVEDFAHSRSSMMVSHIVQPKALIRAADKATALIEDMRNELK